MGKYPSNIIIIPVKILAACNYCLSFRPHTTRARPVQGVRRQVVREALRRLLLRRLLLLLQAEHQEAHRLHMHLCVM